MCSLAGLVITLLDALERVLRNWDALTELIVKKVPNQPGAKKVMSTERYKRIANVLINNVVSTKVKFHLWGLCSKAFLRNFKQKVL